MSTSGHKNGHVHHHRESDATTFRNSDEDAPLEKSITLAEHMVTLWSTRTRGDVDTEALELADKCLTDEEKPQQSNFFERGAVLAWGKSGSYPVDSSEEESKYLLWESGARRRDEFRQPLHLYLAVFLSGMSAVVQGMDQSAVNGSQVGYKLDFGITNVWVEGLVNGAPYLCCVVLGCWTGPFLNRCFGRKGTICISCIFAIASGLWQMCATSTWELFGARFLMGLAIGAKSSTTPAYAAECAPAGIRGAIGTQWQMWTAFGIMLGLAVDVALMHVYTPTWGENSGWRIILGSTAVPPLIVCILVPFVPESPRWYISQGKYRKAYLSLCQLRNCRLQAARDLYEIACKFKHENDWKRENPTTGLRNAFKLFTVPRNRRAAQNSGFLMLMQQMCGVNVIAYYSTQIFTDAGSTLKQGLLFSLGAGIINWLGALPGTFTIDWKGRRPLLLTTFPLMSLCLFFTGSGFYATNDSVKLGIVGTGIYLFMCCYSPGMGPVPFTYSAESYPLEVRDIGMSFATAICWGFNFILALTFPAMTSTFTISGAFYFYAAWNVFGLVYTFFLLPETKKLPLEAVDRRFSVREREFARLNLCRLKGVFGGKGGDKEGLSEELKEVERVMFHYEGALPEDAEKGRADVGRGASGGGVMTRPTTPVPLRVNAQFGHGSSGVAGWE